MTLRASGLTKSYRRTTVLAGIDASFESHAVHLVMGENGAGKSTLLRCLMGIERHGGQVTWNDAPFGPDSRTITPVFDTAPSYPGLTGHQNLSVLSPESRSGSIQYLSDDKLRSRVATYSHGERMRLSLTMALNSASPVLLLDEPTNGLDRTSMLRLQDDLRTLKETRTILLTGHNLEFFTDVVDSVSLIHHGTLERVPRPATPKESFLADIHDSLATRDTR